MSDEIEHTEKPHITLEPQIRAYAKANGLDMKADDIRFVEGALNSAAIIENGEVSFGLGNHQTGTVEQALHGLTIGIPRATKSPEQPRIPVGGNATARAVAINAALKANRSEAKAAEAVALVEKFGNPWKTGNHMHKAIVKNTNPPLAARLSAQVGMNP
ncbi:hypothetical protein ASF24_08215 [Methylobacterium sp. Leaf86]|uniref:hypothetical protein n=1 Tax=Methylobacterium sp. Leaf86 TaxID=1736242 RepID=UPI0006FFB742|nr:hypothetical protein [Methylobacterium sp. Leaf86]KQO49153.1 hypothetical protein ASF24_08215 [Methylobacterium sp. Leaf86]